MFFILCWSGSLMNRTSLINKEVMTLECMQIGWGSWTKWHWNGFTALELYDSLILDWYCQISVSTNKYRILCRVHICQGREIPRTGKAYPNKGGCQTHGLGFKHSAHSSTVSWASYLKSLPQFHHLQIIFIVAECGEVKWNDIYR